MASSAQYGSVPFVQQSEFFRSKLAMPTRAWTDIYAGEHDHAFMVAGASKMALVEDLQASIAKMIDEGQTIAAFRKDFDEIVARHGWDYKGGRNWRTRVIYETNLRQSYHAGREAQMADPALQARRPYGLYRHGGSSEPRPHHLSKDGLVLLLTDPYWNVWSPQNGWRCSCKKYAISARDAERMGLTILDKAPDIPMATRTIGVNGPNPREVTLPLGIDPGFEHRPGAGRIRSMSPPEIDPPLKSQPGRLFPNRPASDDLPEMRAFTGRLLDDGLDAETYAGSFLSEFGASLDQPKVFIDAAGEPLAISDALFRHPGTGELKIGKRDRARFLPLLARAIKEPDEIWVAGEFHGATDRPVLRRRYIARFDIEGADQPGIAVFEWGRDGWAGVTAFQTVDDYLQEFRTGVRLYRRGQ